MFLNTPTTHTMNRLLECFQECRRRGEVAQLFLETRSYHQFATFSVQLPPNVSPAPATFNRRYGYNGFQTFNKRKSPSRLRRDEFRLRNYRPKQASKNSPTPPLSPSNLSQNEEDDQLTSTPIQVKDQEEVTSLTTDKEEVTNHTADLGEVTSPTTENKENPDTDIVTLDDNLNNMEASNDNVKQNEFKEKLEEMTTEILPSDFHDLLNKINNQIKDLSKHYQPVNKELDNKPSKLESEEHSFEDAAVWARNQKKSPKK